MCVGVYERVHWGGGGGGVQKGVFEGGRGGVRCA